MTKAPKPDITKVAFEKIIPFLGINNTLKEVQMTVKTPLRYPGGKSRGMKVLDLFLPETITEYREPFVGGGSVFIAKQRVKYNWINDKYNNYLLEKRQQYVKAHADEIDFSKIPREWLKSKIILLAPIFREFLSFPQIFESSFIG